MGAGGDGNDGGNSDHDESDFDPDAFSITETQILWIDRNIEMHMILLCGQNNE